ncbi:MAG: hypothetical protein WAM39_15855 [Bryobacteraceae bacterium]
MKHIIGFLIGAGLLSFPALAQTTVTASQVPAPGAPVVAFGFAGALQVNLKPVLNAPYQAQTTSETTQHLADGNVIQNTQTSKVARDSQGRTWTEETIEKMGPWSSQSGPQTIVFISDPVAQASYVLHPETKTAEKMTFAKLPSGKGAESGVSMNVVQVGGAMDGGPVLTQNFSTKGGGHDVGDRQVENLGTQQINGVAAQGKRTTITIPANTFGNQLPIVTVTETWYSPDLQMVVQSKRDDPRFGESTFSVEDIQKGEPPADLFQIPSDYAVSVRPAPPAPPPPPSKP